MEGIKANISVEFTDAKAAENIFISLQPETLSALTDRSTISIYQENNMLYFKIDAKDITAFRATLNSYLIWARVLFSISSLIRT